MGRGFRSWAFLTRDLFEELEVGVEVEEEDAVRARASWRQRDCWRAARVTESIVKIFGRSWIAERKDEKF